MQAILRKILAFEIVTLHLTVLSTIKTKTFCCLAFHFLFVQFSRYNLWLLRPDRNTQFPLNASILFQELVGLSGLEPPTLRLSVVRSSQLSYKPVGGDSRDRTGDLLLARQALSQLS